MTRRILSIVSLVALTLAGCGKGEAPTAALPAPDDNAGLLKADAAELKTTVVTPHLEAPITPGRNVLWCSTFQLAWNEMCTLGGGDLVIEDPPSMVAVLNRKDATRDDLDEASYVAMAGWVRDGIYGKIRKAVDEKFHGEFHPRLLEDTGLNVIVAYACLLKDLRFAHPFESIDEKVMRFRGEPVKFFGATSDREHPREFYEQIVIHHVDIDDERADRRIVVELKTTSPDDRLILAMVPPAKTLRSTVDEVHRLIADATPTPAGPMTELYVPKLNFDLHRTYDELIGKRVTSAGDMPIGRAEQDIRFRLDEHGAALRSEAVLGIFGGPEVLRFDRPFLILLERKGAARPYFALWVDNAGLLVREDPSRLQLVDALRFDEVRDFSEGLAAVRVGRRWGYIDATGRMVVDPKFHRAWDFSGGLARVALDVKWKPPEEPPEETKPTITEEDGAFVIRDGTVSKPDKSEPGVKWGFIDKLGRRVVPFKYDFAFDFSEGLAAVCVDGKPLTLDELGSLESHGIWAGTSPEDVRGKWGFIDTAGRVVIQPKYDRVEPFEDGLSIVVTQTTGHDDFPPDLQGKYAFIDRTGTRQFGRDFDWATAFVEGLAVVGLQQENGDELSGYIDRAGEMVIPPRFASAGNFRGGHAFVFLGERAGLIDRKGTFSVCRRTDFDSWDTDFNDGRMMFWLSDRQDDREPIGFFATDGTVAVAPVYADAENFSEGRALVTTFDGKSGFIDVDGKPVTALGFTDGGSFREGLAAVRDADGRWGFIDRDGHFVVEPTFHKAWGFQNGFARVRKDGKVGFIDRTGKLVVPSQFSEARDFTGGFAAVAIDVDTRWDGSAVSRWGFVDTTGKVLGAAPPSAPLP